MNHSLRILCRFHLRIVLAVGLRKENLSAGHAFQRGIAEGVQLGQLRFTGQGQKFLQQADQFLQLGGCLVKVLFPCHAAEILLHPQPVQLPLPVPAVLRPGGPAQKLLESLQHGGNAGLGHQAGRGGILRVAKGAVRPVERGFGGIGQPLPAEVNAFWDGHLQRIYPWYLAQRRDDDVIISASPDFLIGEACRRLGVRWIASRVDPRSGRFEGLNCWGEEKPRRFEQEYHSAEIEEFYSDSLSDAPMMALAERAYVTTRGRVEPWDRTGSPALR